MSLFRPPTIPPGVRRALRLPSNRDRLARELDDEMQFHLEKRVADLIARGMNEADARNEALRRFGDADDLRTYCESIQEHHMRRMQFREWLEGWVHDVRFASRQFKRAPGFVVITVATLALGIGATTAIFSVVNGVLLRALPYPDPDRIVQVWEVNGSGNRIYFADPNFDDVRARNRSFAALSLEQQAGPMSVTASGEAMRALGVRVSRDYFTVLGATPIRGRIFSVDEARPGGPFVVVLSYSFWMRELGGRSEALGSSVRIGNQQAVVVGVMPPSVDLPIGTDLWMPAEQAPHHTSRTAHNWRVIGRMAPNVTLAQARSDMSAIAGRLKQEHGDRVDLVDIALVPLREQMVGGSRNALVLLLGASVMLLLIACANVVNLLVARMAARHGEIALRLALGAARHRLVQQCLAESLMLTLGGCVAGIGLAYAGVKVLLALNPATLPRVQQVSIDWRVLMFALGVSLVAAIALGLIAAWRGMRGDLREALSQAQRTQAGGASTVGMRQTLVSAQVALTLVLLVSAGLLGRSFLRLMQVDPGFRTTQLVVLDLQVPGTDTAEVARRAQFYETLMARLRAIPGVVHVGGASSLPIAGGGNQGNGTFLVMSTPDEYKSLKGWSDFERLARDPARAGDAEFRVVAGDYFATMGIPRVSGRLFEDRDVIDAPHVAVISASLARTRWPNENPIGKFIEFGNMDGDLREFTIVGVVGDVHEASLAATPRPTFYGFYRQRMQLSPVIVMATQGDPAPVMASARLIARELRPDVPPRLRTFESIVSRSVADRRFALVLVGVFAAVALAVAALGVYSVISYLVTQREREISIRVALGACASDIVRLVLGQGATMASIGIVVGAAASFAVARLLSGSLYGISPADPVAFGGVILLLTAAALVASWLPARRAARVEAMDVLRGG